MQAWRCTFIRQPPFELLLIAPSDEFRTFVSVCESSELFKSKIASLKLPPNFEVVIEPWPYGGLDPADENRRYFQGLIFAADTSKKNEDTNFYPFPLPLIPVMDWERREIVRIDELATGGADDAYVGGQLRERGAIDHCRSSEYVPELQEKGLRNDLKPLNVVQPEGPSFNVDESNLVEWQKWRFRVTFNPREGAVLHDIRYDGRSVLYRLSFSEMVSDLMTLRRLQLIGLDGPLRRPAAAFPPQAGL